MDVNSTVIVIDTSNYKKSYTEDVPFKAKVVEMYGASILVVSEETDKEYDLYPPQILECLDINEIKKLLKHKYNE